MGLEIPEGYCQCGCGEKTTIPKYNDAKNGRVAGRPNKYIRWHYTRGEWPFYKINENGCWIWQRAMLGNTGYGQISVHDKPVGAHRVFYEKFKGAIPAGLDIDHLCRVRACVNPEHLEPVTRAENLRRGRIARGII